MLRFRPDVKPPMWGPPSAVAFAVRDNAQKILGANPVACLPLWERGFRTQIFDVFGNVVSAESTANAWDAYGYFTNSYVPGSGVLISLASGVPNTEFSVFIASLRISHINFRDHISVGVDTTWRASVSTSGTAGRHVSYGNGTGYSGNSAEIASGDDFTAALVLDRAASTLRLYVDGKSVSKSYTPAAENLNRVRVHNRVGDDSRVVASSLKTAIAFDSVLSADAVSRLNYEPYTLLMPVARPVYFDLGASAPAVEGPAVITTESTIALLGQKGAVGPATVTASATLGMGGVKGASAPLNIVGTASVLASGQKSTSGPATITAVSAIGADGVKTIAGLDKEGPAIITASASVGMGGVKGALSQVWIGADLEFVVSGVKAGVGSAAWLATGAFWAAKAPDVTPITAAEVARTVRAAHRMKTVTASARVKQVRYEVTRA